jgi:Protein of unknown function (DUF3987)
MHQILTQLSALGYREGDKVFCRLLAGKGFDIEKERLFPKNGFLVLTPDGGFSFTVIDRCGVTKFHATDGYEYLKKQNAQGYGIYLIPNHGGQKDEEIECCPAVFFEIDGIPKNEQIKRIKRLAIEPSLIIETRKSLHVYYRISDDSVGGWRKLQQRLIQLMDSDPAIHNESRLMRLAGFDHQKKGCAPYPITITSLTGQIHERSLFEKLLPAWDESRWGEAREDEGDRTARLESFTKRREELFGAVDLESFPLEICLSKDDRELIAGGAGQGGRNASGFKLAANLIATSEFLSLAGYPYTGDARDLFEEYCDRCNPPLTNKERESIWKSASRGGHSPSLSGEAITNCIKSWKWKRIPLSEKQKAYNQLFKPKPMNTTDGTNDPIATDRASLEKLMLSEEETVVELDHILQEDLREWQITQKILELQERSRLREKAFRQLVASHLVESSPAAIDRLKEYLYHRGRQFQWEKVFSPELARMFRSDGDAINADPLTILMPMIGQTLSLFGKNAKISLGPMTVTPNIYLCVVGDSSTGKSRGAKIALSPIVEMEDEEELAYQRAIEEYDLEMAGEDKNAKTQKESPQKRRYIFNTATIQSVVKRMGKQRKGSLWFRDEIKGLFNSLNQFSNGKEGEGLEIILDLWDNSRTRVDRVREEDSFVAECALSIYGGIQPGIFADLFNKKNNDRGLTTRFLFARVKTPAPSRLKRQACQLAEFFPDFYRFVDRQFNHEMTLTDEAFKLFDDYYYSLGFQAKARPEGCVTRAWLDKARTNTLKILMFLHALECYLAQWRKDFTRITADTVDRAIEAMEYFKSVFLNLQSEGEEADEETLLMKIWKKAKDAGGALTPRECINRIKSISPMAKELGIAPSDFVLAKFRELAAQGFGIVEKAGKTWKFTSLDRFGEIPDPPEDLISPVEEDREIVPGTLEHEVIFGEEKDSFPETVEVIAGSPDYVNNYDSLIVGAGEVGAIDGEPVFHEDGRISYFVLGRLRASGRAFMVAINAAHLRVLTRRKIKSPDSISVSSIHT